MAASLALLLAPLVLTAGCSRPTYQGEGDLTAVDAGIATIAADAIPGVLEATTARFPARPPSVLEGATAGTRVAFRVVPEGSGFVLVGIDPIGPARGGMPMTHDHTPRHGGVVLGDEDIHIEIAAAPDGTVRVYLSDVWRRPLPVEGTTGAVTLHLPSGARTLALAPTGAALEARTDGFGTESALADIVLERQGKRLDTSVQLDLTGERAGVPILPQTACVAPAGATTGARAPRCTITFGSSFTAMAPTQGRVVVAVTHGAVSVWSLPAATMRMGLEPLPPIVVPVGAHEPDPRVVAPRPDGAEIAIAAGPTLYVYDGSSGRYRRKVDGPGGAIRAVAWSPDGARLLVAAAGDGKAHVLDAADGRVVGTLTGDGQVQSVAFDAAGRAAAVTDVGTVLLVDTPTAETRTLTPSTQALAVVAFATERLLAAGDDGVLHVLDPATGAETARSEIGAAIRLLAVTPDGRHAATADAERTLRVHTLPDAAVAERLTFHRATIGVLAWGAGPTLVSGDNDATLAVWDVPAAR
jgi:YD repeat-containing protein